MHGGRGGDCINKNEVTRMWPKLEKEWAPGRADAAEKVLTPVGASVYFQSDKAVYPSPLYTFDWTWGC